MATRAVAGDKVEESEEDEDGIPRISTHMKQISLEHGIALISHSHLPSRSEETIEQLHKRLIEHVVQTVEKMHVVTKRTPTLGKALAVAAEHVAALTAGPSNGQPPAANVKIPSTAQSVLEYEMGIVTRALHPEQADEVVSTPAGVSLLDLSCDSALEWEQFEPRGAISLVEEIADHLLGELLISTVSVLRHMQAKRSSLNFAEAATAASGKNRRAALQLK